MKFSVAIVLIIVGLARPQVVPPKEERTTNLDTKVDEREMEQRSMDMSMMMMDMQMPEGYNHSQCIYRPEEKILSCKGGIETVECSAFAEISVLGSRKFNLWGIGLIPELVDGKIESRRFWLYPRKIDNSSYLNHSVVTESGKIVDLVIYYSEKSSDLSGLRITDLKCWERIVRIFDISAKIPHMVRLETEPTVITEIPVLGEVLVYDKTVQKRWLWGYGWSPYSWGWSGLYSPYYYGGWGLGK